MHETEEWEKSCFVTLTYDEDNLPEPPIVEVSVLQAFLKRLRRRLEPHRIRYFGVGEYGEKSLRPHYHLILFGVDGCGDCYSCQKYRRGADVPKEWCRSIRAAWPYGQVRVGSVTYASASYVAGYVQKAWYAVDFVEGKRLCRSFALMSKGLGKGYVERNRERLLADPRVTVYGKEVGLPKYYAKLLYGEDEYLKEYVNSLLRAKGEERREELREHYESRYGVEDETAWEAVIRHRKQTEVNSRAAMEQKEKQI